MCLNESPAYSKTNETTKKKYFLGNESNYYGLLMNCNDDYVTPNKCIKDSYKNSKIKTIPNTEWQKKNTI